MKTDMSISDDRTLFAKKLIGEMFKIQPGESVAITLDSGGDKLTAEALANATREVGGLPLLIEISKAEHDGQAGMKDWPSDALKAALSNVNVWIEMNSSCMIYSEIWEAALAKGVRYLVIGDSTLDSLKRVFNSFQINQLTPLLTKVKEMVLDTKVIRIRSNNGTDVSYETNLKYPVDFDDGDFSTKVFGTAPGYVNVVPKQGTMNGTIVFDTLMFSSIFENKEPVKFLMKNGEIVDIQGGKEAEKYKKFLTQFDDKNVYKISHNMIGLNPGVRELCGQIVEDERIWGGVDFGFGHTSPMDMPPDGQPSQTHFDGVVAGVDLFFDDTPIFENGEVVHPELKNIATPLLCYNNH